MLSLPDTLRVQLSGLEHCLWINGYWPTWTCMIIDILGTRAKFLELSVFCTAINCTFTFRRTIVCDYFHGVMTQFELSIDRLLNLTTLHIHLCDFQIRHKVNQRVSAPTNTILSTTVSTYLMDKILWMIVLGFIRFDLVWWVGEAVNTPTTSPTIQWDYHLLPLWNCKARILDFLLVFSTSLLKILWHGVEELFIVPLQLFAFYSLDRLTHH